MFFCIPGRSPFSAPARTRPGSGFFRKPSHNRQCLSIMRPFGDARARADSAVGSRLLYSDNEHR
jgi:hypothetical protein